MKDDGRMAVRGGILNIRKYWPIAARLLVDSISWIAAVPVAYYLRFDGALNQVPLRNAVSFGILTAIISGTFGSVFSLYKRKYRIGSLDEVVVLSVVSGLTTTIFLAVRTLFHLNQMPRLVPVMTGLIASLLMASTRIIFRSELSRYLLRNHLGVPTLIYGAGISGRQIIEQMVAKRQLYSPIGFIEDDLAKKNFSYLGIKVLGTGKNLESLIQKMQPEILVVAISNVSSKQLALMQAICHRYSVSLKVIPSPLDIQSDFVSLETISDITEEDLLGRHEVTVDEESISKLLRGKCVLVTGAGGSIGSEIVRQCIQFGPTAVYMLDRDETALLNLELSIDGTGTLMDSRILLSDIRDFSSILGIFEKIKPDIVFHAAALKHLPLLERFPAEAQKTNIEGTKNVLLAAKSIDCKVFVNISTDKAADPISSLGYSKLTTERLTSGISKSLNVSNISKYLSVRFGNVIGSSGSVLPTFRAQIKRGGPVTVTDPNITRYFMTVKEAVRLVLQSAVIGESGETLILDMGGPIKILEVAKRLIAASGKRIEIVFTGLRPGEKLHETLFSLGEQSAPTSHPLITKTSVQPLSIE